MAVRRYDLLQVTTQDQLKLSGLCLLGETDKTAYIFIHGFTSDFYLHDFYHAMADSLHEQGNSIVLAQHRGTGMVTEFLTGPGQNTHLGSYYERLEDAHLDITAYIDALRTQGYTKIGLIGHSLGTIKLIRYLFEGQHKNDIQQLILLAPFDKNAYMQRKMPGRLAGYVEKAREQVGAGNGRGIVPVPEFEDFPMSYQTYVSWYEDSEISNVFDFYRKDYLFPTLQAVHVPALVVLGEDDEFITFEEFDVTPGSALAKMKEVMPTCETVLVQNCGHTFVGHEDELVAAVAVFTQKGQV